MKTVILFSSLLWGLTALAFDCGVRQFDGTGTVSLACEPAGTLTSPLRIHKNGTTYGLALAAPGNNICASKMKVQTSSGAKQVLKMVSDGSPCQNSNCCGQNNCSADSVSANSFCAPAGQCYSGGSFLNVGASTCMSATTYRTCASAGTWSGTNTCPLQNCSGNNFYYVSGNACNLRSYTSTQQQCSSGSCQAATCTAYSDSQQVTTGGNVCKQLTGCSGATPGSLNNTPLGTNCGVNKRCDGGGNCSIEIIPASAQSNETCNLFCSQKGKACISVGTDSEGTNGQMEGGCGSFGANCSSLFGYICDQPAQTNCRCQ